MSPEYLEELADMVDPDQLWRLSGIDQRDKLTEEQRRKINAGVVLRRHADYVRRLNRCHKNGTSLLITPLWATGESCAQKEVETPKDHLQHVRKW